MPKTEYQFASVAKRYGSGLLTRISRVRITSLRLNDTVSDIGTVFFYVKECNSWYL